MVQLLNLGNCLCLIIVDISILLFVDVPRSFVCPLALGYRFGYPLRHGFAVPPPPKGEAGGPEDKEPLGSPSGGAVERSETERANPISNC
jgi:hypothetical protein